MTTRDLFTALSEEEKRTVNDFVKSMKAIVKKQTQDDESDCLDTRILLPVCVFSVLHQEREDGIQYVPTEAQINVQANRRGWKSFCVIEYFKKLCNGTNPHNSSWGQRVRNMQPEIATNNVECMLFHQIKEHRDFKLAVIAANKAVVQGSWERPWSTDSSQVPDFGPLTFEEAQKMKKKVDEPKTSAALVKNSDQENQEKAKPDDDSSLKPVDSGLQSPIQAEGEKDKIEDGGASSAKEEGALKTTEAQVPSQLDPEDPTPTHSPREIQKDVTDPSPDRPEMGRRRRRVRRNDSDEEFEKDTRKQKQPKSVSDQVPLNEGSSSESSSDVETEVPCEDLSDVKDIEDIISELEAPMGVSEEERELHCLNKFHEKLMNTAEQLTTSVLLQPPKKTQIGSSTTIVDKDALRLIAANDSAKKIRSDEVIRFLSQPFVGVLRGQKTEIRLFDMQVEYCIQSYSLLQYGRSNSFFILAAKMGAGKTIMTIALCLLMMSQVVDAALRRDYAIIFCPKELKDQWEESILSMCEDACVLQPDTNDPLFNLNVTDHLRLILEGKRVFIILQSTVLGNTTGKRGNDPSRNVENMIKATNGRFVPYIVKDEFHLWGRNGVNISTSNAGAFRADYRSKSGAKSRVPILQLCSGTPTLARDDSVNIIRSLSHMEVPSTVLKDKDLASKVLNSVTIPSAYDGTVDKDGANKRCAEYIIFVPTSQHFTGDRCGEQARLARCGHGDDPFENPMSLYTIIVASLLFKIFGESSLLFWDNVQGMNTLRRYIQQTLWMKNIWYFQNGSMSDDERENQFRAWKEHGGIFMATTMTSQVGYNRYLTTAQSSPVPNAKKHPRYIFTIGVPNYRAEAKAQQKARLDRTGQVNPSVMSFYVASNDEYTEGVQAIIDSEQSRNSAATNVSVIHSDSLYEKKRKMERQRREGAKEDESGNKRSKKMKAKSDVIELDFVLPLVIGLRTLADSKKALNLKEAGFMPDPDSDITPLDSTKGLSLPKECAEIRTIVYRRISELEQCVEAEKRKEPLGDTLLEPNLQTRKGEVRSGISSILALLDESKQLAGSVGLSPGGQDTGP